MRPVIITTSVTLALTLLLGLSWYQIKAQNREAAELLVEVNQRSAESELLQKAKILRNTAKSDLEAFDNLTLDKEGIVPMIEKLESAGRNLDLETKISTAEEVEGGVRLSIESEGDWRGAFSYLKAVESLPYRVVFEKVNLSKSGSNWRLFMTILLPL